MAQSINAGWRSRAQARRDDWLRNGVVSGFIATFAMTVVLVVAYVIALSQGDADGHRQERWYHALAHNPVTERTEDQVMLAIALNLLMGLVLGLVYARVAEPILGGPGWRKGIVFALVPWLLSLVIFLPMMGGGIFGVDIGAGPLPAIGNLVLHLVYGAVLGSVYAIGLEAGLDDTPAERANAAAAERGMAIGLVVGLVAGLVAGWALGPQWEEAGSRTAVTVAGALIGAASGMVGGSFLGMGGGVRQSP